MPNDREVEAYLQQNPEFFAERAELLDGMALPQSDAEPFAQRRLQALRERQALQRTRLDSIVDVAKSNQALARKLHRVACGLLRLERGADDAAALIKARFDLDAVAILLSSRPQDFPAGVDYALLRQRVKHLSSVCDDRVPRKLGATLFPDATTIASCAFVPLFAGVMGDESDADDGDDDFDSVADDSDSDFDSDSDSDSADADAFDADTAGDSNADGDSDFNLNRRAELFGVMVLGDADPRRFQPAMGRLFLDRLGQLVGAHLAGRDLP